jgi:mRNA-degrading endonuclease HigB of HigAB toxin-antitoxin module
VRLIGRAKLVPLKKDPHTAKWVVSWIAEVRDAQWKRPADVAKQFPSVLHDPDGTFLFLMPQRSIGVRVLVAFAGGVALVVAVRVLEVANEN